MAWKRNGPFNQTYCIFSDVDLWILTEERGKPPNLVSEASFPWKGVQQGPAFTSPQLKTNTNFASTGTPTNKMSLSVYPHHVACSDTGFSQAFINFTPNTQPCNSYLSIVLQRQTIQSHPHKESQIMAAQVYTQHDDRQLTSDAKHEWEDGINFTQVCRPLLFCSAQNHSKTENAAFCWLCRSERKKQVCRKAPKPYKPQRKPYGWKHFLLWNVLQRDRKMWLRHKIMENVGLRNMSESQSTEMQMRGRQALLWSTCWQRTVL